MSKSAGMVFTTPQTNDEEDKLEEAAALTGREVEEEVDGEETHNFVQPEMMSIEKRRSVPQQA